MKQNKKNGAFTWAVVFAWVFGIVGVAGVMYMLFTNEDYNGMGGTQIDSTFIAQSDVSLLDSAKKDESLVPKVADNTPKTNIEKQGVKTIDAPPAKPVEQKPTVVTKPTTAQVKPKPTPAVVKPTPVVVKPTPVAPKPVPVAAKPAPTVTKTTVPVPKPVVVQPKPAPQVVKTNPQVAKPVSATTKPNTSYTAKPAPTATSVKPKPSKPRPDKSLSDGEMENIVNDILQKGEENGIYAKCVQLRGTSGGNNKTALQQLESFLRSRKFTIAGRETTSADINGIKITPGNGCMKLTVGNL